MRTFICLEIPPPVAERLGELQRDLKTLGASVSWTRPGNIHLTLKFLGEVAEGRVEAVKQAVARAAAAVGPFEVEVGGAGCFPTPRRPRVLWVGLSQSPQLRRLQAAVEDELGRAGFPREGKKFAPHLTIGRVRQGQNAGRVAEELARRGFAPTVFRVGEVIVMRSDLNPAGSVYTPQAIIPLRQE